MNEEPARRKLTDICKLLYDRNLTVSAGGNMSIRLNDVEFLITPSGRNKGMLNPEDMVKMNIAGEVLSSGKPSIESRFHLSLYTANPDVNSVLHCHPLNCTALAVNDRDVKTKITPEGVILLGDVPMIGYFTPGSEELANAVAEKSEFKAMLMSRHGAITQGNTVEEAFNRMEELEFQAKLQLLAGDTKDLPKKEIEKLKRM